MATTRPDPVEPPINGSGWVSNDDSDDGGHAQRKDGPAVKRSPVAIPPSRLDEFEVTLALITGASADRLARHQRDTAAREATATRRRKREARDAEDALLRRFAAPGTPQCARART